jgi:hypothetical protein
MRGPNPTVEALSMRRQGAQRNEQRSALLTRAVNPGGGPIGGGERSPDFPNRAPGPIAAWPAGARRPARVRHPGPAAGPSGGAERSRRAWVLTLVAAAALLLAPAAALGSHQTVSPEERGEAVGTIALVLLVTVGAVALIGVGVLYAQGRLPHQRPRRAIRPTGPARRERGQSRSGPPRSGAAVKGKGKSGRRRSKSARGKRTKGKRRSGRR